MIIDRLENAYLYEEISPNFKKAFHFLRKSNFEDMLPGKYEIEGTEVFALVQHYETNQDKKESFWEAHRKYIDVQYIYEGFELIGYSCIEGLKVSKEYDEIEDYLLLEGEGSFLKVKPYFFAIFFPADAHMPSVMDRVPAKMKKVVVKIQVDCL